jgi:uncharacterized protein (DUF2236 family)
MQSSNFAGNPWQRLVGTLRYLEALTFGDRERADKTRAYVDRMHANVAGIRADGVPYDASDPELLLWVHASLVDTILRTFEYFVRPLSLEERERFYHDSILLGELSGVPRALLPETLDELRAYIAEMIASGEVAVSGESRQAGRLIMHPPTPWWMQPGSVFVRAATAALLQPEIRAGYGLRSSRGGRALVAAVAVCYRRLSKIMPRRLRVAFDESVPFGASIPLGLILHAAGAQRRRHSHELHAREQ